MRNPACPAVTRRASLMVKAVLPYACAALILLAAAARQAQADTDSTAQDFVENTVQAIMQAAEKNVPASESVRRITGIIAENAEMEAVSRLLLGPPARTASAQDMSAFRNAVTGYLARRYTPRFRDLAQGSIRYTGAKTVKSRIHSGAEVRIPGGRSYDILFVVSLRSGRPLVLDIVFSGISMLKSERQEISALYEKAGRDIGRMTEMLDSG